jgi:hypothetical protein
MKHQVVVQLRTGDRPVVSPLFEQDEAERELQKVREQQERADLTDLSWLSVTGTMILSAHVEPLLPGSVKRAA